MSDSTTYKHNLTNTTEHIDGFASDHVSCFIQKLTLLLHYYDTS